MIVITGRKRVFALDVPVISLRRAMPI